MNSARTISTPQPTGSRNGERGGERHNLRQIVEASLWRPMQSPVFRNLLFANVVSDVGTFMQNVGAAWLMVSLNVFLRVPDAGPDLTPWNHWRLPPVKMDLDRPVLVTVEYDGTHGLDSEFLETMREYGCARLRDGASRWGISRDLEVSDRYLETFMVLSWEEHGRQHDRMTRADSELENRLRHCTRQDPIVRHLVYL